MAVYATRWPPFCFVQVNEYGVLEKQILVKPPARAMYVPNGLSLSLPVPTGCRSGQAWRTAAESIIEADRDRGGSVQAVILLLLL